MGNRWPNHENINKFLQLLKKTHFLNALLNL